MNDDWYFTDSILDMSLEYRFPNLRPTTLFFFSEKKFLVPPLGNLPYLSEQIESVSPVLWDLRSYCCSSEPSFHGPQPQGVVLLVVALEYC